MIKKPKNLIVEFIYKFFPTIVVVSLMKIVADWFMIAFLQNMGEFADGIFNLKASVNVWKTFKLAIAAATVVPLADWLYNRSLLTIGEKFDLNFASKYMQQKYSSIACFDQGELLYRINWDAIDFRCYILSITTTLVIFTVTTSYMLYKMVVVHHMYGILCFIFSAFSIAIPFCFRRLLIKLKTQLKDAEGKVFALENSLVVNREFIYVHNLATKVAERVYEKSLRVFKEIVSKYLLVNNVAELSADIFTYASQAAVFLYGSYLVYQKSITPGAIVFSLGASKIIQDQFMELFSVFKDIWDLKIVHSRLKELLSNPESVEGAIISKIEHLSIANLSFAYGDKKVIKDLSLELKQGETIAIRGQNGSGKTTLVKVLSGFYDNYQGSILVNGIELKLLEPKNWRENIIVVPQDAPLFDEPVEYNLALACKVPETQKVTKLVEEISLRDIEGSIGELGCNISGGQKQRLCLGWLYLKKASLAILDEPTASLDRKAKDKFLQYLKKDHTTKIIITHDDKVTSLVDRVYNL